MIYGIALLGGWRSEKGKAKGKQKGEKEENWIYSAS